MSWGWRGGGGAEVVDDVDAPLHLHCGHEVVGEGGDPGDAAFLGGAVQTEDEARGEGEPGSGLDARDV